MSNIEFQIQYLKEDIEEINDDIIQLLAGDDEPAAEHQTNGYVNELKQRIEVFNDIIASLKQLANGSQAVMVVSTSDSADVERLPEGTEVMVERKNGSKTEYVDAEIIGYQDGKPCVRTFWGAIWNLLDPKTVQRKEAVNA